MPHVENGQVSRRRPLGRPLFKFLSQSFAPCIFFPIQFDTLISNIVSVYQISEKIAVAGRLKVNFGQFRQFSSYCAEFSLLGDLVI